MQKTRRCLHPAVHIPCSNGRKGLTRGTEPQDRAQGLVMESVSTVMSKPAPWHPSKCKSPPHSRAQQSASPLKAELRWPRDGCGGPGGATSGCEGPWLPPAGTASAEERLHLPPEPCGKRGCFPHRDTEEPCPERSSPTVPLCPPAARVTGLRDHSYCKSGPEMARLG